MFLILQFYLPVNNISLAEGSLFQIAPLGATRVIGARTFLSAWGLPTWSKRTGMSALLSCAVVDNTPELCSLLPYSLNPAHFLGPDAGDPEFPAFANCREWGERSQATEAKATFKAEPVS